MKHSIELADGRYVAIDSLEKLESHLERLLNEAHYYCDKWDLKQKFVRSLNTYLYLVDMVPDFKIENLNPYSEEDYGFKGICSEEDQRKIKKILKFCGKDKLTYRYIELVDLMHKIDPVTTKRIIATPYLETGENILDVAMTRCYLLTACQNIDSQNYKALRESIEKANPQFKSNDSRIDKLRLCELDAEMLVVQKLLRLATPELKTQAQMCVENKMKYIFIDQTPFKPEVKAQLENILTTLFRELPNKIESLTPIELPEQSRTISFRSPPPPQPRPEGRLTILQALQIDLDELERT